jgi:uncharacterized protein YqgC (DUF456 family)
MVLGIVGVGVLTDFHGIGLKTIAIATGLAFAGEILEAWVSYHYSRKFGGSRRAGWGALIGGLVGAIVGVPVPVVGSVIGSFAGAFLGAAVLEYTGSSHTPGALRVGWGAIIARTWAVAARARHRRHRPRRGPLRLSQGFSVSVPMSASASQRPSRCFRQTVR